MSGRIEKPQPIAGRVPPHDLDAEAAVLATILLDKEAIHAVRGVLGSNDFYSESNQRIFDAACAISDGGTPIDILTVAAWLRDRGMFHQVGGPSYLAQLTDCTPAVIHVEHHARIVAKKATLRRVIAACQRIYAEGYGDIGDHDDWLSQAAAEVTRVAVLDRNAADLGASGAEIMKRMREQTQDKSNGDRVLVYTGIGAVDRVYGPMKGGHLVIVLGWTSTGKTAFCMTVAALVASTELRARCDVCQWESYNPGLRHCEQARAHWCPKCGEGVSLRGTVRQGVCIFSLEMPREECLIDRMIASLAMVESSIVDHAMNFNTEGIPEEKIRAILGASGALNGEHIRIVDKVFTMSGIRAEALRVKADFERKGIPLRLIVVDYAQRVEVDTLGPRASREEHVAEVGRQLKRLAAELEIPIMLPGQLNDDAKKAGRKPRAEDARESKALAMDADRVVIIYNQERQDAASKYLDDGDATDEQPEKAELIFDKVRGGKKGTAVAAFHPSKCAFTDWNPKWEKPHHVAPPAPSQAKRRR